MKITVFWFAWSWTSTIWKLLSEKLDYKFMSSWNIMRWWAEELGYSIYEFENKIIKDDSSFDLKLDLKVKDFWKSNDNFVFESRLAWHFIPESFKIYLKCDEKERYKRIQNREWLLIDEVIEKTKKRETELEQRYGKIYPNIKFPPKEKTFDFIIDVTKLNPQEIVESIISRLSVNYMY